MDEPEVVIRVKSHFESQGFRMKGQPLEGDITLNGGDIRCDLQGFKTNKVNAYPQLLWIECKGDYVALKELLSDFVSLLLILDEYGGQAVLACPDESYRKIIEYKEQRKKEIIKHRQVSTYYIYIIKLYMKAIIIYI